MKRSKGYTLSISCRVTNAIFRGAHESAGEFEVPETGEGALRVRIDGVSEGEMGG
jgi:hypothetical protein